jgi:hypothetical protein
VSIAELRLEGLRLLGLVHTKRGALRLALASLEKAREQEEMFLRGLPSELKELAFRFSPNATARLELRRLQEQLLSDDN